MPEVLWFFYFCFYCLRKTLWFVYFYVVIFIRWVLWCLNFEQVNFWILINMMNKTVVLVICAKCSKLITLEQNITSAQQLLLCLILFFVFPSEVLESGIKSCFDRVPFQDAVIMLYLRAMLLLHEEFRCALLL